MFQNAFMSYYHVFRLAIRARMTSFHTKPHLKVVDFGMRLVVVVVLVVVAAAVSS